MFNCNSAGLSNVDRYNGGFVIAGFYCTAVLLILGAGRILPSHLLRTVGIIVLWSILVRKLALTV